MLAGKRNASVLAAILQSPEELKAAYEDAQNAEGSALKENEKYMDSIQGRIDQFNNALQTMWKNALDDDFVKLIVKIGTELVKWIDALGPIKTLIAGIAVYLNKKYNLIDFKQLFNISKPSNDEIAQAELELQKAQKRLENTKSTNPATLKKYQTEVDRAKLKVNNLTESQKNAGKVGTGAFKNLGEGVKKFGKQIGSALLQMAAMYAIMKIIEGITWLIDQIPTAKKAAEAYEGLVGELESTKDALQNVKDELDQINDKIAEINSQESLSFVDEEELARLKEERAELERELELNEALAKQKQQQVNNQVSDQVEYYKNKGVKSGKTTGEHVASATGTAAMVGAGATALAAGSAAAGGANIWNPIGWGLLATAAIASITAAVAYGIAETEEKVGESIENMSTNLKEKEEALEKARAKYQKSGKDGDKEKYEEAQKALTDYRGEMAKYFTDLDAYYKSVDLKTIEDPDEYASLKKEMEDFYNERDRWLINSKAEGAKVSAIERIFNKEELKEASANIDALLQKLQENPGDQTLLALIANQAGLAKADLEAVGLSVDDAIAHFTQFSSSINADAMVDPMKTAMSAIDTYASKMQTLASIQSEVANGFIISAEKAREFAAVYPEILQSAQATANGQIQLNAGVVNALLTGERAEADAAMETDKDKIEGAIAVLKAKKAYLEAQLSIMEAEAEGNRQLAINQVELMQERYNQAVEANIGEAEAYQLAMENMGLNATEFDKVVADVANNTSANMSGAATQMSTDMYDGYKASADSANAFGFTAWNAAKAPGNPSWSPIPFGGKTTKGSGGFKANTTNGRFTKLEIDKKILDVKFDNLKLNLTNQLKGVDDAIANAYGALALMDTNIKAPLSSFDPDKDSGGDSDKGESDFDKYMRDYEEALAELEHQREFVEGQTDILEAQEKGISNGYYKQLIDVDDQKMQLYEGQLGLLKKLAAATSKTKIEDGKTVVNEEWYDIADKIREIEKAMQDTTLAAIEAGKAMVENWTNAADKIKEAYDNFHSLADLQKESRENYAGLLESQGHYTTKRIYDEQNAIIQGQRDANKKQFDELYSIYEVLERGGDNPFDPTTEKDKWDAFQTAAEKGVIAVHQKLATLKNQDIAWATEQEENINAWKDTLIEAFDGVRAAYDNQHQYFENMLSMTDSYRSRLETWGINVPDKVLKEQMRVQKLLNDSKEEDYFEARREMIALENQGIGIDDQRYIDAYNKVVELEQEVYEGKTEIMAKEQELLDNQLNRFNQVLAGMNHAADQLDKVSNLMSDDDIATEDGEWTNEGLARAGLAFQSMEYAKKNIEELNDEIAHYDELLAEGKISEKKHAEVTQDLTDKLWSEVDAMKSAEDSIVDLAEARIDAIEEGLQEEINAYESLIALKKEELSAEKD